MKKSVVKRRSPKQRAKKDNGGKSGGDSKLDFWVKIATLTITGIELARFILELISN
ncbi:MAG: hypothetical protein LBD55_05810 [Treponema sp.]|jgi:hypothetical protein|nr:hypothetical protein [Treponema sp.]